MAILAILILLLSYAASEELLVGGQVTLKLESSCTLIKYRQNFKAMEVKLQFSDEVENFVITDSSYDTCPEGCDISSLYCVNGNAIDVNQTVSLCSDFLYLYIRIKQPTTLAIETQYITDQPCQGYERDPANFCQYLSVNECMQYCAMGCGVLRCLTKFEGRVQQAFAMCLPYQTSESEKDRRCEGYDAPAGKTWESCIGGPKAGLGLIWIVISMGILMPLIISLISIVFYYRQAVKRTGRAPYNVPNWCPNCLFPRVLEEEGMALREMH